MLANHEYTIDELLVLSGDFGKMQWFWFFTILLCNIGISMYYYQFPYLELIPKFTWKFGRKFGACTKEAVWENHKIRQWKIDWNNDLSIHNWITDSEEYWISSIRVGLIGSCYFVGILLGSILFQSSDWIGRKMYSQLCSFFSIVVIYLLYFTDDIDIKLFLWVLLGILSSIFLCSYAYLLEVVPKASQNFMNYLFLISENIIPVLIGSTYFYMGGKNWEAPFTVSLIFPLLGFTLLFFIPKSPQLLLEWGRDKEVAIEIKKIARFNGKKLPKNFVVKKKFWKLEHQENISKQKYRLFTTFSKLVKLFLIIVLLIHSNSQQIIWGFYVKHIKINIFLLNIIDAFTSTSMMILTYVLLKYINPKPIIIFIIIFSGICIIPILIKKPDEILLWISYLGLLACMKTLACVTYSAISRMFSPLLVPVVLTVSSILTNIAMVFAPIFAEAKFPLPMLIFIGSSILTLSLVLLTPIDEDEENNDKSQ